MKNLQIFVLILSLLSCSKNGKIKYNYVGDFEYKITDSTKFHETYLSSNSFGYTFGDLEIQGININAPEKLKKNKSIQYIISLNSPIISANTNFDCDCYPKNYNPLEVKKKLNLKTNRIYIYEINDKRVFKHTLP